MDGSEPGGIYRESGRSMEVVDACSNDEEVVSIETKGVDRHSVAMEGWTWGQREKRQSLAPVGSRQPRRMIALYWENTVTVIFPKRMR